MSKLPARRVYRHFTSGVDRPFRDLYVEIQYEGDKGTVWREIALDAPGQVVHRMPSENHRHGEFGMFDMVQFSPSEASDLTEAQFAALWNRPDRVPPPAALARRRSFVSRAIQGLRYPPPRVLAPVRGAVETKVPGAGADDGER